MKRIKLTRGKYAMVDDGDYEWLNQWNWSFDGEYAQSIDKNGKHIRMHRIIMNTPLGKLTDHINGNRLDNRRTNLRICDFSKNSQNSTSQNGSTSNFKGIHWHKASNKWKVEIGYKGKNRYIGIFQNERQAALAYDLWAKDLFGEYAKLNFIHVGQN